jgi:hypothetical protein
LEKKQARKTDSKPILVKKNMAGIKHKDKSEPQQKIVSVVQQKT